MVNTWQKFHDLAFQHASEPVPMIPVTVRPLVLTGALFKKGGYRSYCNYLSAIKTVHVEANHQWTQLLAHTGAWVTRSVLRGIGPAHQSCSFAFHKLCALPRHHEPLVECGPANPVHVALLASLFLLREVEASTAVVSSWTFDADLIDLTWALPSSRSDRLALGVKRTWGSLCGLPNFACPYQ